MADSRLRRLLSLDDSPRRTAAAFAVGVFLSFSPLLGLQILLAALIALVWRLNKVAVFVGLNTNLPWLVVPWYAGTTWLASRWMGAGATAPDWTAIMAHGWWTPEAWSAGVAALAPWMGPFLIGGTAGAGLVAATAYAVLCRVLDRRTLRAPRIA